MAGPPTTTETRAPARAGTAVRRAPFSENPTVGARGQRTRQRILDAALQVFGDEGYHSGSIDQIAKLAAAARGCPSTSTSPARRTCSGISRGRSTRQVSASTEALDPLTADLEGWAAMRAWVARYDEIHARYEPVFVALRERRGPRRGRRATPATRPSRGSTPGWWPTTLPSRQLDPVIRLLLECLNHTLGVAGVLRSADAGGVPARAGRDAITDVLHRTLFGARPA